MALFSKVLALAVVPVLVPAGGELAPRPAVVAAPAVTPVWPAKRHRPGIIWRFFHNGGNGGNGGGGGPSSDGGGGGPSSSGDPAPRVVRPGDTVTVAASGRRPGARIFASLYGPEQDGHLTLSADLPAVAADRTGAGIIRWTVTAGLVPGRYTLLVEAPRHAETGCRSGTCADFEVGR